MKRMENQINDTRSPMSDAQHLSELRIVLMGHRAVGKSSTGNSILGREEFDLKRSAQCVRRHGEVADRHITVIEAPGWWINLPVEESPELLKQEILLSVSLCPSGPHVVLLIIRANCRFKETERKAVQGHLDLLGERVWSHTIVLFTHGDSLLDTSIEQHIESEGQDLQWLLDKCGNRYHVLNNQNRSDHTQIKELLEKIEETVAQNDCCYFEIDRKIFQEMKETRRTEEERADERMKRIKKQRDDIRSQMSNAQHLSELRIVLLGYKRAGKSSTGNSILGREEYDLNRSSQGVERHGKVADRHITVIEAPGWWRTYSVECSSEILKQEILLSVCPPGPHAVLLIICVYARFKETERKALQGHLDLLGERVWSHTIVLFTHGDSLLDTSIEQHIESEGQDLQWLLDKCGNRYHVLNNQNRSDHTQIKELLEKIEETVAQNNGCHFEIDRKIIQRINNKRRAKERMLQERVHIRSQTISEQGSYSWSLRSSAHGSVVSQSEADSRSICGSSSSRDSLHSSRHESVVQKTCNSMEFPPNMSGDERWDTKSMGSSAYGSFGSLSGADSRKFWGLSHSRDSWHTSRYDSGDLKIYNSMELPTNLSEDKRSDSSLGSLAHGSIESLSGAESRSSFGSPCPQDSWHTSRYESGVLKICNSMELPTNLSGDQRWDTRSLESSAYGSFGSLSGADIGSVFSSSQSKVSSHSSEFRSVEHLGTKRAHCVPNVSELTHDEDTEKT